LSRIKIFIGWPYWNFIGAVFGILTFLGIGLNMNVPIIFPYTILIISLLLLVHGLYRLWKQKQSPKCDIQDDCVFDGTLGSPGWRIKRKTNEKFCYDCKGKDGNRIHLIRKGLSEWFCPKCKRPYNSKIEGAKDLFMKNRYP